MTRRQFGQTLGAGALAGCVREPAEKILPYTKRPPEVVPGRPRWYAPATSVAGRGYGLLVETREGRPTKIEGNPDHPSSRGATTASAQAALVDLYDPSRAREHRRRRRTRRARRLPCGPRRSLVATRRPAGRGAALPRRAVELTFLGVHAWEYAHHAHEGALPGRLYPLAPVALPGAPMLFTRYFFMTGLHALHVAIVVVVAWLGWRTARGLYPLSYLV